jgi:multidrug resistance efflux pump
MCIRTNIQKGKMTKVQFEIPKDQLDKAAKDTIKDLERQITNMKAAKRRAEEKLKEKERDIEQAQTIIKSTRHFIEDIRYLDAFYMEFNERY